MKMNYEEAVKELRTTLRGAFVLDVHLPNMPKDGTEHYKWLVEQLERKSTILLRECTAANILGNKIYVRKSLSWIEDVVLICVGLTFAFLGTGFLFLTTILTLIWHQYEKKTTEKFIQEFVTHVEKKLLPHRMDAEGLLSRILEERSTHSK